MGGITGQVEREDSNFLCSEYDMGDDRAAYETDWREMDHSWIGSGMVTGMRETQTGLK